MTKIEIEERVFKLETEVKMLKDKLGEIENGKKRWWEKIAGTFSDSEVYDEAMKLGREYRESQLEDYDLEEPQK